MKSILIITFAVLSSTAYSQNNQLKTVISKNYYNAENFSLINSNKDTIMLFEKNGTKNFLVDNKSVLILKKRKNLIDNNGNVIAKYKRKKIYFPLNKIVVEEKKTENGWEYYQENNKILEVKYYLHKNDYYISTNSKKLDEITLNLIRLSMGRFEKSVIMDYDANSDFSTYLIIAILIALI